MGKFRALALTLVLSSAFAHADILTLTPGTVVKSGVNISTAATFDVGGVATTLTTVGSGLRQKNLLIELNVYIAQLFVSDVNAYVKTEKDALNSLDNEAVVAIRLDFINPIPISSQQLVDAFGEGLDVNGVDPADPDILKFNDMVNAAGVPSSGHTMNFVFVKNADKTETLTFENTSNGVAAASLTGAAGLTHKILSIWLGESSDNEIANLKAELLK